nr:nuclear/nucleolar gtpase 2 [Quercus suber]
MVLHDWQRGKIPFFVPSPRQEDKSSDEPNVFGADQDEVGSSQASAAAFRAIANVISSQQQMSVPVQRDLFSENELRGDTDKLKGCEKFKLV